MFFRGAGEDEDEEEGDPTDGMEEGSPVAKTSGDANGREEGSPDVKASDRTVAEALQGSARAVSASVEAAGRAEEAAGAVEGAGSVRDAGAAEKVQETAADAKEADDVAVDAVAEAAVKALHPDSKAASSKGGPSSVCTSRIALLAVTRSAVEQWRSGLCQADSS